MDKPLAFIIEDDPTLNEIFTLTLGPDFETETILDGDTAMSRLADVVPALVVLDLHLPGKSGREILAGIRADARLLETRVILATADSRQADIVKEQADIVLLKPISPLQLKDLALRFKG